MPCSAVLLGLVLDSISNLARLVRVCPFGCRVDGDRHDKSVPGRNGSRSGGRQSDICRGVVSTERANQLRAPVVDRCTESVKL